MIAWLAVLLSVSIIMAPSIAKYYIEQRIRFNLNTKQKRRIEFMADLRTKGLRSSYSMSQLRDENITRKRKKDRVGYSTDASIDTDASFGKAMVERRKMMSIAKSLTVPPRIPKKKKTLVLDLDETLIHSTSKISRNYDFMIEVMIEKQPCLYYVYKRPHVDYFLSKVHLIN